MPIIYTLYTNSFIISTFYPQFFTFFTLVASVLYILYHNIIKIVDRKNEETEWPHTKFFEMLEK